MASVSVSIDVLELILDYDAGSSPFTSFETPSTPRLMTSVQLGYLEVTVQEKLRSGWPGPFVKVEGCCV
jgi:hypothetical protein